MVRGAGLYSHAVAVLKVGLPLLALVLLASLFLLGPEDRFEPGLTFADVEGEALGQGMRLTRPVLTGATRDAEPFRFTAELVVPDAAPPTRAEIAELQGVITFAGTQELEVAAPVAEIDLKTQIVTLDTRAVVTSSDGYRLSADRMELDLVAGTLHAWGDVDAVGPAGTIAAGSLAILPGAAGGGRRTYTFGDGVRVIHEGTGDGDG